ncbi:hypothetical protein A3A60_00035 [Candidatus Curtissbacteria bacterium RIFCSPLOWO2_01_FULL_42_26]|uniref:Ribosomal protein n=1 Tax=Candidatus Curtissbacteria bacterium RIFCSPLOWO2_01_FULL_42_26 TaxID=1797729 RepID=A0A1F5I0D8_9BACT|nr:MAG: hypothetical protein A3A60_00035 [Candidatus Curtissbacteria bacterium RIFCSPLOWO2_01_FULL_42_26]
MGTTRIKVIDLSSDQKEIKTSRKHAEKLSGFARIKKTEKRVKKPTTTEDTEIKTDITESTSIQSAQAAKSSASEKSESKTGDVQQKPTLEPPVSSVVAKKQSLHHKGTKYLAAKKIIEDKNYGAKEALELLPKASITKFDPAVEVHLNVTDQSIKAKVSFPHATGQKQKEKRYLIFSDLSSKTKALEDKRIIWGDEKSIIDIESGNLKPGKDFDILIASPKFMPLLAKVAKILGPKGLMPNPKAGTILDDPQKYFENAQSDTTDLKMDPTAAIVHAKIGRLSQSEKELEENLKAIIVAIGPAKIQKAILKSTMSPAIRLDVSSL